MYAINFTARTNIWNMTPCSQVGGYQYFGGTYCLHFQGTSEEDGSRFFHDTATDRDYTRGLRVSGVVPAAEFWREEGCRIVSKTVL
jgi:hypothetical protein